MNISEKLNNKIRHTSQYAQIFEHLVDNRAGLFLLTNRDRDAFVCGANLLKPMLLEMYEALQAISKNTYGTELSNSDAENNEILAEHFFIHQNIARKAKLKFEEFLQGSKND